MVDSVNKMVASVNYVPARHSEGAAWQSSTRRAALCHYEAMAPDLLHRRAFLTSGLAGLAALFSRKFVACGSSHEAFPVTAGGDEFSFTPVARPTLVSSLGEI